LAGGVVRKAEKRGSGDTPIALKKLGGWVENIIDQEVNLLFEARIYISYERGILDLEGKTVNQSLKSLGTTK